MSIKVMGEVWDSSSAKGGARLVLLALADHANDEGYCHPSVERLAVKSALTARNVQLILRDLERRGELVTLRGAGRGHVNTYWVLPPATVARLTAEGKTAKTFHPLAALEKRAKNATEKAKTEAEKAKSTAEKVKPASPRTVKNRSEPSGTITDEEARAPADEAKIPEIQPTEHAGADAPDPALGIAVPEGESPRMPHSVNAHGSEGSSARGAASRAWAAWLESHGNAPPVWLDHGAWRRWLADLDERRSRVTCARLEEQLHRLEELSRRGEAQASLVARAIGGGWETFYPERRERVPSRMLASSDASDRYGRYR